MKAKNFVNSIILKSALDKSVIFAFLFVISNIIYHFIFYGLELIKTHSSFKLIDLLIIYLLTLISVIFPLIICFSSILFLNLKLISSFTSYRGNLFLYQTLFLILGISSTIVYKIIEAIHLEGIHISVIDTYFLYTSIWICSCYTSYKFCNSCNK